MTRRTGPRRDGGCAAGHRAYARRRARQIAYGRWAPWADAEPVHRHVRALRQTGASYRTIARAAGVSASMVARLHQAGKRNGAVTVCPRVGAVQAHRLLAVSAEALAKSAARRPAAGARRRLQALIAIGYPPAGLAKSLGVPPRTVSRIIGGQTATVSTELHAAIRDRYDQLWDIPPPTRTPAQRRAAATARRRAAAAGWPAPMGLDDDRIDDPAYQPQAHWRPAGITSASPEDPCSDDPGHRTATGGGQGQCGHGARRRKGHPHGTAR